MRNSGFVKLLGGLMLFPAIASGWDYEGHRIINRIALASLPHEFPTFVREPANAERIAFLSGEADRWRNTGDLPLKHCASPDHYLDYEQIAFAGIDPKAVPEMRYDFVKAFAAGRQANAARFQPIDVAKNQDHTAEWPGFAPWIITESYGKLKSGFSYLKTFEELGTSEEIANAKANIIYVMGVMGHFVGDCSQPLHLTIHHNGWVGENPKEYTRWPGFHAWIDGGFNATIDLKAEQLLPRVRPAQPMNMVKGANGRDPMFDAVMAYIASQFEFVEPIYTLEKAGDFKAENVGNGNGRRFIEERILTGGQQLGAIWLTAWKEAQPDTYLRVQLEKRKQAQAPVSPAAADKP